MKRIGIVHRTLDPEKSSEYRTNWLTLSAMLPLIKGHTIVLFVPDLDDLGTRLRSLLPERIEVIALPYPYQDKRLHHPLTKRWVHRKWQYEVAKYIVQHFGRNYFDSILIGSSLNWDNYCDFSAVAHRTIVGPIDGGRKIILQRGTFRSDMWRYLLWVFLDSMNRRYLKWSNNFDRVLKGADVIIANTSEMIDLLKSRTEAEMCKLPDTVAGEIVLTIDGKINYIKGEKLRLLWVGSISFRKNPMLVFELASEFRHRNLEIVICGSGKGQYARKFLRQIEFFDNVVYLGPCSKKDLEEEYKKSDFVFFTSIRDGYTNVYMEAYENLTPCIVTNAMASGEFNCAYLNKLVYQVNDLGSLVKTLKVVLEEKEGSPDGIGRTYRDYLATMIEEHGRLDVNHRARVLCNYMLND